MVEAARTVSEERRLAAFERFLEAYHDPLLNYVRHQFRLAEGPARDSLHDFILSRVIRKDILSQADRTRGKFRTFLVRSLNHFLIDELRMAKAGKRSPDHPLASLEELEEGALDHFRQSAQTAFDLEFARGIVHQALLRMRARCEATNRKDLWKVFHDRVLDEAFEGKKPLPYDQVTAALGVSTQAQAANLLTSAKRMFARVFKSVIRDYEADDAAVEEEIKALRHILSNA